MFRPGGVEVTSGGEEELVQFTVLMDSEVGPPTVECHPLAGALVYRAYRAYGEGDGAGALSLDALCAELVGLLEGERWAREGPPGWLRGVVERLSDEPGRTPSLGELAGEAGVHATHLARVFRRRLRCTPGEYLRGRRLEAGAARLASGDEPIARIVFDLGFADQSHFGRHFRRVYGVTPGAYRRGFGER